MPKSNKYAWMRSLTQVISNVIFYEGEMIKYTEGWQDIDGEHVYVQNISTGLYNHKEWHCWSHETGWSKLPEYNKPVDADTEKSAESR